MDKSTKAFDERSRKNAALPLTFRVIERCVWAFAIAFALLIGLGILAFVWEPRYDADRSDADCERIMVWATGQKLGVGSHPGLALPPSLSAISADGMVDVEVLADGRTILLFRTSFFAHDNYYAVVYASAPFMPAEFDKNESGQPTFNLDFCDLIIWKKISDRHYVALYNLD